MGLQTVLDTINQNLFNVILKNVNTAGTTCSSVQNMKFPKIKLKKCKVTVSQDTQVLCNLQKISGISDKTELLDTINQSIDNASSSTDTDVSEFLATAISSNNTDIKVSSYIKNILETNITDEMLSSCIASSSVEQLLNTGIVLNCSNNPNKDNTIIQNIQIYQFASCITSKISNILLSDTTLNNIKNKATSSTDVFKAGLTKDFFIKLAIVAGLFVLAGIVFGIIKFQMKK